jgi:hypothetical protein
MTGDDVKSEFFENFKQSENTNFDTQILRQINRALSIISGKPYITLVETAVSVTSAGRIYAMPAGVTSIQDCYISGQATGLRRINPSDIYKFSQLTTTGIPQFFWEDGENICLHPMPDQAYTLFVMATGKIPALTALTDTINLRNAVVGPPAIAATALADNYCICIPEFVTFRILEKEKGDYKITADAAREAWNGLLTEAVDAAKIKYARRFSGAMKQGVNSLAWATGYGIR